MGDLDVETFPMLVIADEHQVHFAGPLTPQPETLQHVLRVALHAAADAHDAAAQPPEIEAFAQRLRLLGAKPAKAPAP